MKKIIYSILAAATVFTACNREIIVQEGEGSLALDLSCKTDYNEVETKAQTNDEIINALSIDIFRPFDGWKVNYTPFSTIKGKIVELGSGSYILTASSPVKKDAAYDQPIFEGTAPFDIRTGEVTSVAVTCSISNAMASIVLSENFVKELASYTVTVSNGKGNLSWTKAAGTDGAAVNDFEPAVGDDGKTVYKSKKAGYFTVAPLTVTVDGYRAIDGTTASTTYTIADVKAADHHIIKLDANVTGSLGGITITISNEEHRIDQPVIVPGFPETGVPDNKPDTGGDDTGEDDGNEDTGGEDGGETTPTNGPTLTWEANPTFNDIELPLSGSSPLLNGNPVEVEVVINAENGIKEFYIDVDSKLYQAIYYTYYSAVNPPVSMTRPFTIDVVKDTQIHDLFFGEVKEIEGQTSLPLSMSELVPLINTVAGSFGIVAGDEHIFTIRVVDNNDNEFTQNIKVISVA